MKPKTKIVIASLLKPIDDPRMFERFGSSLQATHLFEIHIVGYVTNNPPKSSAIHFHPLFQFTRLSMARLLAPWKFYNLLIKVKPHICIVNSHDLLIVTVLYKILFGLEILYDVQENYFLNILYTDAFPIILRPIIGAYVRLKEMICAPLIHHFFLAENIYARQLPFIKERFTVVENKYEPVEPLTFRKYIKIEPEKHLKMVFTGTISKHYGIYEAIHLANNISRATPASLLIIGRCANRSFLQELKEYIADKEHITLVGDELPVDHQQIVAAIKWADVGIVSYLPNKSTSGRVPTKVFEYMAHQLPFWVLHSPKWLDFAFKYHACLAVNDDENISSLIDTSYQHVFYDIPLPTDELLWQYESQKMLSVLLKMIK